MKLTKKQAEKLQTLKTEEEIRAFFETEAVQLDPETLEEVSGGGFDFLRKTIICEATAHGCRLASRKKTARIFGSMEKISYFCSVNLNH